MRVLRGVTLDMQAGRQTALVGPSGSGKSTIIQLLMRFYDPDEGQVLLDGRDLREYNLGWLRRKVGLIQ